ncbi:hypothetical protein PAXRUDRAFT_158082 [Paxillus rubicundulus Ve08.2h10]|uniref:Uncharacterized protein n=1 Tax=Paxillus rubicundulus Ve08.2h10 TaxID=930991 RepID=A0A0D0CD36_9AGAM|nr:hypothetical protein PAXRUDRAFT_158082 [Paxillus rubicundulus Ve08.2h10]
MHSDNYGPLIPMACRFIPYDQWFLTHLDDNWKVKQVKHWILSKCNLIQSPDPPTQRPVSPITFASSIRTRSSIDSFDDGYHEDDEYDDDSEDGLSHRRNGPRRPTIYSRLAVKLGSRTKTVQPGSSPLIDQYTLISFSTGLILEDDFTLSWYNLRPYELLEMHRAGTVVSLPRDMTEEYTQPYFEAKVRALRVVWSPKSGRFEAPGHDTQHELHGSKGKEKLGAQLDAFSSRSSGLQPDRRRRAKVEWKDRWVIVNQGILTLCKEQAGNVPVHQFSLSTLKALRGADSLERACSIIAEQRVVCMKFRTIHPDMISVASPPLSTPSSLITEGWKTDRHQGPKVAASRDADGSSFGNKQTGSQEHPRESPAMYDSDDICSGDGEWVVLDMLDDRALSSILRILHRYAPHPISSSFLPSSSIITVANQWDGASPATTPFLPHFAVPYPEWRINIVENARKAGMGYVGKPMAWVLWTEKGLGDSLLGNIRKHRRAFSQEMQYKMITVPSDLYPGSECGGSDDESEMEWEGWMRDLERQGRVKKHSEKVNESLASTQTHTSTRMSISLPSPPLSDTSSSGSPRRPVPFLPLPHPVAVPLNARLVNYPNISNIIKTTCISEASSCSGLAHSPERIQTTTVSTVSVGPSPPSSRRRSSTLTPGLLRRLGKDRDKRDAGSPSGFVSMNGPHIDLGTIHGPLDRQKVPGTSLRHAQSNSNLRTSSSPYMFDIAESRGHLGHAEPPSRSGSSEHQSAFVRGVSIRAGKIVKGLDSAIDFVEGKTL